METLASLLVGQPQYILVVAMAFLVGYLVLQFIAPNIGRRSGSFLIASIAWGFYAAWEWLVLWRTPEANIRVDLMLIWPALLVLSFWFSIRAFR